MKKDNKKSDKAEINNNKTEKTIIKSRKWITYQLYL